MTCRAGLVWDTPQHFNRYIEECGIHCELVTPYMLAAPYFRGTFNCLIIPTGFANPAYCHLLPALRATAPRIKKFVESGGHLLVFGAAMDRSDAYDWLPFTLVYQQDCHPRSVECQYVPEAQAIIEDYDPSDIECDGVFTEHDGDCAAFSGTDAVFVEKTIGRGKIIVTSIHEFPSRTFIKDFCAAGTQTLF